MKIAIITEGKSEYKTLPLLYREIHARTKHRLLSPLKVDVSPDAPAAIIASACLSRLKIASASGAGLAVVLLDREQRTDCPGKISAEVGQALSKAHKLSCAVVLKDRTYENWLIADLLAMEKQSARFKVTQSIRKRVEPDKADSCDGGALIKLAATNSQYDKTEDSRKICSQLRIENAAQNSRSFRHFLHVIGDDNYTTQCKLP